MITELKRLSRNMGASLTQIEATFIRIGWDCKHIGRLIAPFIEEVG